MSETSGPNETTGQTEASGQSGPSGAAQRSGAPEATGLTGLTGPTGLTGSNAYAAVSPTTLADLLGRDHVMDIGIRPLWPSGRVAGPGFTVQCPPGDNLMLHAAIYRAAPGSIIVVQSGDVNYALAGGNVCAVAQRHGIAAFVLDGLIRDVAEARELAFPVFARGVIPIPGAKAAVRPLNGTIRCGGVTTNAGDMVVADEEGIVVVPAGRLDEILSAAQAKTAKEATETLDDWEKTHRSRIEAILAANGFTES